MIDSWEGARVKVVEQAAAVLYAFAGPSREMGVRELARTLGISATTVQRIVTSLEHVHLLSLNERTRKYVLGPGVLQLAAAFPRQNDLVTSARPHMEALWRATQETVCLHVSVHDRRVTIHQLESPHELRFTVEVGRAYPLHAGSAGRCLLAFLPEEEMDRILSRLPLEPLTASTIADPTMLRDELARDRRQGYVVTRGERVPGGCGIAAPILADGRLLGSISIYGPEYRLTPERVREYLPHLLEAARRTAEQFTWSGGVTAT